VCRDFCKRVRTFTYVISQVKHYPFILLIIVVPVKKITPSTVCL